MMDFKLRSVLEGHGSDVKSLSSTPSGLLISGSRDKCARVWTECSGVYDSPADSDVLRTSGFVNSVAVCSPKRGDGPTLIFVAGTDGKIRVYSSETREVLRILEGHRDNVCCLYFDIEQSVLLSGSWDLCARVWALDAMAQNGSIELKGHEGAIWGVCALPNRQNTYLTASADRTIKLWNADTNVRTFTGHEDAVRALCVIDSERFVSTGNDGAVIVWNINTDQCLNKFASIAGQFIYCMLITKDGFVMTGSEGGHIELWAEDKEKENSLVSVQQLQVPAESVWCLAALPNNDIAVGSSDGKIWLFTRDSARVADSTVLSAFDATLAHKIEADLASRATKDDGVITIKIEFEKGTGGPPLDLKYKIGEDPQVAAERFILENRLSISYQQEIVDFIYANVPQANRATTQRTATAPPSGEKKMHNGKEWDYVFDISTEDGKDIKLTYNTGEDPYFAAQRCLQETGLPVQFLNQLANFVIAQVPNASSAPSGTDEEEPYVDPFTGGSRYVPGGSAGGGGGSDPFTGAGRYIPGSGKGAQNGLGGGDPFTGSGRYVPGQGDAAAAVAIANIPFDKRRPLGEHTPLKAFLRFGLEGVSSKVLAKLRERNDAQNESRLTDEQLSALGQFMNYAAVSVSDLHLAALQLALSWPVEDLVPVLDVFRVALLHKAVNAYFLGPGSVGPRTITKLQDLMVGQTPVPVKILVCRALANACTQEDGRKILVERMAQTIELIGPCLLSEKPVMQIAASYALANFCLILLQQADGVQELGPREDCIKALTKALALVESFADLDQKAVMALLQAVVTILWGDATSIQQAKELGIQQVVNGLKDASYSDAHKTVARNIECMFDSG